MNIKKLLLLLVLLVPIQAIAQAIIIPITPGGWSVTKGYIVTTPTGEVLSCGLAEYRPELAFNEWSLECVPFDNPEPYIGYPDNSLRKG